MIYFTFIKFCLVNIDHVSCKWPLSITCKKEPVIIKKFDSDQMHFPSNKCCVAGKWEICNAQECYYAWPKLLKLPVMLQMISFLCHTKVTKCSCHSYPAICIHLFSTLVIIAPIHQYCSMEPLDGKYVYLFMIVQIFHVSGKPFLATFTHSLLLYCNHLQELSKWNVSIY